MLKPRFDAVSILASAGIFMLVLSGCTGEEPVEIDLDATIPPTSAPADSDDPNAAQRQELQQLAEQQCLNDPELVEGTVRIVDPATNEIVSELIIQCAEVR